MWQIALLIIVALLFLWMQIKYSYWKFKNIPSPDPEFFFGNIRDVYLLKKHYGTVAKELCNKFSQYPFFGFYKGFQPILMINDPTIVKNIMIKDQQHFGISDFGFSSKNDPLFAVNLSFATGEEWKHGRALLSPIFSTTKLKSMFPLMKLTIQKLEDHLKEFNETCDVDAKKLATKFTTFNVINCALSIQSDCFENENSEFLAIGKNMFDASTINAILFMILCSLSSFLEWSNISLVDKDIDKWIRKLVHDNLEKRKIEPVEHEDFVQSLLNSSDKFVIDEEKITGYVMSFFIEGHETSSLILSFVLYELARNQSFQEELYHDIIAVLDSNNNELSFQALQEMESLENVMYETLRLRPALPVIQKLCTKSYELPLMQGQSKPFIVPEGMIVAIPILYLHNNADYYPNPDVFDPTRFVEDERKIRNRGTYLGFGEGPRICTGLKFALLQMKAAAAVIIKNYKIVLSPNCKPFEINSKAFMYNSKNPLLLNFIPRK